MAADGPHLRRLSSHDNVTSWCLCPHPPLLCFGQAIQHSSRLRAACRPYACPIVASFGYIALNTTGERVQGTLAAENEQAVLAELESRALTPVSVERRVAGGSRLVAWLGTGAAIPGEDAKGRAARTWRGSRGLSPRMLGDSYQMLADLLNAGVPLLRGLTLLGNRKGNPRAAGAFRSLAQRVEQGSDLAAAMGEQPAIFATGHIAMVRAGERGGFLETVLAQLGKLVIKRAELRSKLIGNLIYPLVLVAFGLLIGGVIFGVFVPKSRVMFSKLEAAGGPGLPGITRLIFGVSDALTTYGLVTASVIVFGVVAFKMLSKRPGARAWIEQRKLRLPVVGGLLRGFATAGLCRLLGTMLASNVPMLSALHIARDGTSNPVMRKAIEDAAEAVKDGQALTPPLERSGMIDDDILEMIRVGESANNLADVLLKISEMLESRLDRLLNTAVKLIEPLLLVMIASIVGAVAAGLLLPLTKMSQGM